MAASGELYRVTWVANGTGGAVENVWHVRGEGATEDSTSISVAFAAWWPNLRPVFPTDCIMDQVQVQQLTPIPLLVAATTINQNGAGSGGGQSNSQVAAIVTWRTPFAGRRQRGRSYFAIPTGNLNINSLQPAYVTTCTTMANSLLSTFDGSLGSQAAFGVYSRATGGGGPSYNISGWLQVTTFTVQSIAGAQRRRRLGRGA